jgi:hypothetical protein
MDAWEAEMKMLGGTQQSGFIQAMMGRESENPAVQAKFQQRVDERNAKVAPKRARGDRRVKDGALSTEFLNTQKFKSSTIHDGFDINEMSKATHDLMRHKKILTVEEAIKRFYDFLKKHAPQHQPLNNLPKEDDTPLINYRGAYDIPGMFDRFTEEEEVEVEDEKDEDDGKYDDPDPGKYKELFDLIRQSNDDRQGKNFTDKENARMVHLLRYYNLDDDAPEMPYAEPHTRKRMILLRFMTPKEQRGEEMTLEDLQEMDRRSEREREEREKRDKKLREDMKAQEEKNKRYRIEEAKAKRGEKPSDEFIHTVLGVIYRDALKEKEKKGKVSLRDLMEKERKEKK